MTYTRLASNRIVALLQKIFVDVYWLDHELHDAAYSSVVNPHDAAYSLVVNPHDDV